ncbi:MAG TPA: MarR family winged helix-turn-helix transcriptional regulator [Micromonosporaceae bacterium]|nr:MarR family winged helix-turn-helix transcriptional regulator [Micromonosporaceae bacterium]
MDDKADRPGTGADDVAAIEQAVVAIRRAQTRRRLARLSTSRGMRSGRHAGLPDAVFELLDAVASAGGPTVTEAAAALGVDQPRVSRLAAQAIAAGLLRREVDQADGRRSPLVLTDEGRRAIDQIRDFRQAVIRTATSGWDAEDRATLARLLLRFVADVADVTDAAPE